ncbi:hypothetical protein FRACA_190048 [Frankia canadensis]|uniref:Uncharacterized protein n=2 Tax=Frankia canadensis TaxID=1836972 RepID=A0A2I2KPA0_9ACTN|nr:hypothetical protein FRACA_190048 [Frankia canadensis]SOU54759.1 hypothetical protein FRACA_190048 [Frankia canadensis]
MQRWRLSAEQWNRITDLVRSWPASGSNEREEILAELVGVARSQAKRFGRPDDGTLNPPPRALRNVLQHGPGIPEPPADDTASQPKDNAPPTGGEIRARAIANPAAEEPLAALATLLRRAGRQTRSLSTFHRGRVSWAETEDAARPGQVAESLVEGMRVIQTSVGPAAVHLLIAVGARGRDGDVLAVTVTAGESADNADSDAQPAGADAYLLPLWRNADNELITGLDVATTEATVTLTITEPFPATLLGADEATLVRRSVPVGSRSARNAWRRIARARREDDTVRGAIVDALR